ncbi:MAG: hypothetical protein C4K49_10775 [Candidatus Thorarchaeota archaeon]|nr:MAG: hypothetical protein C4K49_10775 [Candidatus Thorarchaeota archaeon]
MNKRLQEAVDEHQAEEEEWRTILDQCDKMLFDDDYDFASDTIQGIRDHIVENKSVTPGQRKAIVNIRRSVENRDW